MSLGYYKSIGDTLSDAEFNGLVTLYRRFMKHSDEFEITDEINTDYGKYEFDIEDTTILDTGILITDETISAEPKVRLSNALFPNSSYTLILNVLHYTGVNILDDVAPSEFKVVDTLEVELVENEWIDIPVTDLEEDYIISFDAKVSITHDKVVRQGSWLNELVLSCDKSIVQTDDSYTLTAFAKDIGDIGISGKSVDFIQKNKQILKDGGTSANHKDIWDTSNTNLTFTRNTDYSSITETTSGTSAILSLANLPTNCVIDFEIKQVDGYDTNQLFSIYSDSTYKTLFSFRSFLGYSTSTVGTWFNVRVIFEDGKITILNRDDHTKSATNTITGTANKFRFVTDSDCTEIQIRNVVVYTDEKVYPVGETLFEDGGVTGNNHNDWWVINNSTMSVSAIGTTITANGGYSTNWANKPNTSSSEFDYTGDCVVEFDLVANTDNTNPHIQFYDGTNLIYMNLSTSVMGHYKFVVLGNKVIPFINGVRQSEIQTNTGNPLTTYRVGFRVHDGKTLTFKNFKIYETVEFSTTNSNGIATCNLLGDGTGIDKYIAKVQDVESNEYELLDCSYYETIPNGALRQGAIHHQSQGKSSVAISDEWSTIGDYSIKVTSTNWGWGGYRIANPLISKKGTIKIDCKNTGNVGYYAYIFIDGNQQSINVNKTTDFEGTIELDYDFSNIDGTISEISIRGVSRDNNTATTYMDNIRIYPRD